MEEKKVVRLYVTCRFRETRAVDDHLTVEGYGSNEYKVLGKNRIAIFQNPYPLY